MHYVSLGISDLSERIDIESLWSHQQSLLILEVVHVHAYHVNDLQNLNIYEKVSTARMSLGSVDQLPWFTRSVGVSQDL